MITIIIKYSDLTDYVLLNYIQLVTFIVTNNLIRLSICLLLYVAYNSKSLTK